MRKLGIVGGTSWNSTALYYRQINEGIARSLGGLSSAPLLIESLDLAPYALCQAENRIKDAEAIIVGAARNLKNGGADAILIASNTTNRYAGAVEDATGLPVLPIADPTIAAIKAAGHSRISLLGTRFTMGEEFGRTPYEAAGLDVVPVAADWAMTVDRIIFSELAQGIVKRTSQRALKTVLTDLVRNQVEAVVLACTELVLAIDSRANVLPVFDTTEHHARAAVDWLLEGKEGARVAA